MSTDIEADFNIYESGTNRLIVHTVRPTIHTDKESGHLVTLGRSIGGGRINIIAHTKEQASFSKDDKQTKIDPGKYYVDMTIMTSFQNMYAYRQAFIVGESPINTYWLGDQSPFDPKTHHRP